MVGETLEKGTSDLGRGMKEAEINLQLKFFPEEEGLLGGREEICNFKQPPADLPGSVAGLAHKLAKS